MRGLVKGAAIHADVGPAEVVDKEENEVGSRQSLSSSDSAQGAEEDESNDSAKHK